MYGLGWKGPQRASGCNSHNMLPALRSGPTLVTSQLQDVAVWGCPKEEDAHSPAMPLLRCDQAT